MHPACWPVQHLKLDPRFCGRSLCFLTFPEKTRDIFPGSAYNTDIGRLAVNPD